MWMNAQVNFNVQPALSVRISEVHTHVTVGENQMSYYDKPSDAFKCSGMYFIKAISSP